MLHVCVFARCGGMVHVVLCVFDLLFVWCFVYVCVYSVCVLVETTPVFPGVCSTWCFNDCPLIQVRKCNTAVNSKLTRCTLPSDTPHIQVSSDI